MPQRDNSIVIPVYNEQDNIKNRMVRAFVDLSAVRWMKKQHLNYEIEEETTR